VIQSASLPEQRTVVGTISNIAQRAREAGIGMPALTVVGEVVRLRERLRWYDTKPLFGLRVLVTRAEDQAGDMVQALRDAGAAAIVAPAISIAPPDDAEPLARAVRQVSGYTWLVLTSRNGVNAFFTELRAQAGDARRLGGVKLAAIGPATAAALRERGVEADAVPAVYRGEAVAEAIIAAHGGDLRGVRVLLCRAAIARDALPDALRARGGEVDVVAAYRTLPAAGEDQARLRGLFEAKALDVVTFTSTSTVDSTLASLGERGRELLNGLTLASIGPITSEALERHGLRASVTASEYTVPGLIDALERHRQETRA
jgi:uroporphyrinogen III methyltransferase/synthase